MKTHTGENCARASRAKQGFFPVLSIMMSRLLALLLVIAIPAAWAAPSDLDGSFGTGGVVTTNVNATLFRDMALHLSFRPDGRILASGTCDNGGPVTICLAQYNPDGSLDPTFGNGGTVVSTLGSTSDSDFGSGGALQADGKLVVAGSCSQSRMYSYYYGSCVSRFNVDGSLDTLFGAGGFVVFNEGMGAGLVTVAIQGDGKIVAAGICYSSSTFDDFCAVRYNADGSLDTSFGNNGVVVTSIGGQHDDVAAMAIQGDGKILLTGQCQFHPPGDNFSLVSYFCTTRYTTGGVLDSTFNGNGIVVTNSTSNNQVQRANGIALQRDGKIVVSGYTALVRYNVDGSLDTAFGTGGVVDLATWYAPTSFLSNVVTIQDSGKILVASGTFNIWNLSRYNVDGTPDLSFSSTNGVVSIPLANQMRYANEAAPYVVGIQPDGKIVAGGTLGIPSATNPYEAGRLDFALVRYLGDPTNHPPVCTGVAANISVLPTPDHSMQLITLAGATDPDGDPLTLAVTGVMQDEPVNGAGDGNTSPDAAPGPQSNQVYIRAERSGTGDGRVYHIAFKVTDSHGASCSGTGTGDGTVLVSVPRGQSAIDSGALYNSFGQ